MKPVKVFGKAPKPRAKQVNDILLRKRGGKMKSSKEKAIKRDQRRERKS